MTLPDDELARHMNAVGGMRHYILTDDNVAVPVHLMAWAEWFQVNDARRIVGRTDLDGVIVSTVFLGLDHSWGPPSEPRQIFETLVFGGPLDQEILRYATWAQAEAGHATMVERVRACVSGTASS